jgi:hypothetical protein
VKKLAFLLFTLLVPLYSFDNHFVGVVVSSGNLDEPSLNIKDDSFVSAGIKTGILSDNIMVYVDYQHFTFSIDNKDVNYNEDLLSFGVGPVFKLIDSLDIAFYVTGVAVVDKFHYSEEILKDKYNKYLSQYQLFLGYEFGLIFPVMLNPFHNLSDSFIEIGYRQVYRNDSVLKSANNSDIGDVEPFTGMSSYFFGLNFLF